MKYVLGNHVRIAFPEGHEHAQMNGMTGKVVNRTGGEDQDGVGRLALVWMDRLWGSIGFADEHLKLV